MDVSDKVFHDIQQFVIQMYAPSSAVSNINDLRVKLFHQGIQGTSEASAK